MKTIVALYDDRQSADDAEQALLSAGIDSAHITVESRESASAAAAPKEKPGFFKRIFGLGVDENYAGVYAEGVNRGSTVLSVMAEDDESELIEQTLERFKPVDTDTRASAWREQGWTGYDESRSALSDDDIVQERQRTQDAETRIPIVEEQLRVGKESIATGQVRVRSYVQQTPVSQDVELTSERVTVEHRPVTGSSTTATAGAFEEKSIMVETFEERPVVKKEARVVEEVVIKKDVTSHKETVRDDVKRTVVDVDDETKRSPWGR